MSNPKTPDRESAMTTEGEAREALEQYENRIAQADAVLNALIAENDDVRLAIDARMSANPVTTCEGCGLAYGEDGWIECVVPDEAWNRISPTGDQGGILCITCIARRLKRAGLSGVPAMLCGTEAIRVADQEEAFERGWSAAKRRIEELESELPRRSLPGEEAGETRGPWRTKPGDWKHWGLGAGQPELAAGVAQVFALDLISAQAEIDRLSAASRSSVEPPTGQAGDEADAAVERFSRLRLQRTGIPATEFDRELIRELFRARSSSGTPAEARTIPGADHELKVWPEYFTALERGEKTFEFRRDDRTPAYQVGDVLRLREWGFDVSSVDAVRAGREAYTGRECLRRVTYVARGGVIPDGYCVMSVVPLFGGTPDTLTREERAVVEKWTREVVTSKVASPYRTEMQALLAFVCRLTGEKPNG
jgi:hypothetical protein